MMTSKIFKAVDFTKTQKCREQKSREQNLPIKKFINYTSRATILQKNSFVAEVTIKSKTTAFYRIERASLNILK